MVNQGSHQNCDHGILDQREESDKKVSQLERRREDQPRVVLATGVQARSFLVLSLIILGAGAACYAFPGADRLAITIIIAITSSPFLLVAGILFFYDRSYSKAANRLFDDPALGAWTVPDPQWQSYLNISYRSFRWLAPLIALLGLVIGVTSAAVVTSDGNQLGGSTLATFAILITVCTAIAAAFGAFLHFIATVKYSLASSRPGEILFGEKGYYLPGEYRPWFGFGQRLKCASIENVSDYDLPMLAVTFRIKTRYGDTDEVIRLPIAPGSEWAAADIVQSLNEAVAR